MTTGEGEISNVQRPEDEDEWIGLSEWAKSVNESIDEAEELEWLSFLGRGLYNLDKLKRPKEKDAPNQ